MPFKFLSWSRLTSEALVGALPEAGRPSMVADHEVLPELDEASEPDEPPEAPEQPVSNSAERPMVSAKRPMVSAESISAESISAEWTDAEEVQRERWKSRIKNSFGVYCYCLSSL